MNNFRYKLINPYEIEKVPTIEKINKNDVIVRPIFLSICAADQRYYFGNRDPEIIKRKLPLSLIHESIGVIVNNGDNNEININDYVILLPNKVSSNSRLKNYEINGKFMSSNCDGFMQELIVINKKNIVTFDKENLNDLSTMALCELMSVVIHSIDSIKINRKQIKNIALFGDGNLSYLMHLYLLDQFPNSKIFLFGINEHKMNIFSKKIKIINAMDNDIDIKFDLGIEMVGGSNSSFAINSLIKYMNPLSKIILLGVSEQNVNINTRLILEKGLSLIGRSRSTKSDFIKARNFIYNHEQEVQKIITEIINIKGIDDIHKAFKKSKINNFKTLMKWDL